MVFFTCRHPNRHYSLGGLSSLYLEILDDIFKGVVVVVPPGGRDVEHHVVQISKLVYLRLERLLNAEESLRYLLHQQQAITAK